MAITVTSAGTVGSTASATFTGNVVVQANVSLISIQVSARGNSSTDTAVSSITLGGTALSLAAQQATTGVSLHAQVFYLTQVPAPGTYTLSITTSGAQQIAVAQAQLDGVDPSAPVDASALQSFLSVVNTPQTTITTNDDGSLIVDCIAADANTTATPNAGQTEFADQSINFCSQQCSHRSTQAAGGYSMGWTQATGPNRQAHTLVAYRASTGTLAPSIEHQSTTTFPSNSSANFAQSVAVSNAQNRLLLVAVAAEQGTLASASYAGVPMTLLGSAQVGTSFLMSVGVYALAEANLPASGANTLNLSIGGDASAGYAVFVTELSNVAASLPVVTASSTDGDTAATSISTSVSVQTAGAWCFDVVGSGQASIAFTPDGSQVQRGLGQSSSSTGAVSTLAVSNPGSVNVGWQAPGSNRLVHLVVVVNPTQPPGPKVKNALIFGANF